MPPLEVGDKVRIRPNREREWHKAGVLTRSYLLEDDQGRIYRTNRRQMISVPNDQPMHPPLRDPVIPTLHDSPRSPQLPETDQPASTEKQKYQSNSQQMHTGHQLLHARSGRQVKKPERLIESC